MHGPSLRSVPLYLSVFCLALCVSFYAVAFFIAPKAFAPPGESAWKGYVVLYVSQEFSEQMVLDLCAQEKIGGVLALAGQKPFSPPPDALMGNLNAVFLREDFEKYEQKRANFFFDSEHKFRLFYVEGQSSRRLLRVAARVRELGAVCGVNVFQNRSFAVMIICAAVYLVFCLAAKNRAAMALGGAFIACFSLFAASENSGAGAVLALYSLFLLQKTGLRKGFFLTWLKKIPNALSLAISFFLICVQPRFLPFFLLSLAGSASALYLLNQFNERANAKREAASAFQPVPIMSARVMPVVTSRSLLFFALPAAASIVFFVLHAVSASLPWGKSPALPSPASFSGEAGWTLEGYERYIPSARAHNPSLPSLAELVTISWKSLVFPYVQLREDAIAEADGQTPLVMPGEKVGIPEFSQSETGAIRQHILEYVFDESFISSIIFEAEKSAASVLEKVLLRQGGFIALDYAQIGAQRKPFAMGALALAGVLPLAAIFILQKGKKIDDWSN